MAPSQRRAVVRSQAVLRKFVSVLWAKDKGVKQPHSHGVLPDTGYRKVTDTNDWMGRANLSDILRFRAVCYRKALTFPPLCGNYLHRLVACGFHAVSCCSGATAPAAKHVG